MVRVMADVELFSRDYLVRRIRLFRNTPNGDDDPRVREAVLREENVWLRKENTRLTLEIEHVNQMNKALSLDLRRTTGASAPSPASRTQAAAQMEEEDRRRGQTPQQRAFNDGLAEGRQDRSPITDGRGNVLDIRENVGVLGQGEIRRETPDEYYERLLLIQLQRDTRRKVGLVIFVAVSLFAAAMLYFNPIILTWILNGEIR